MKRIINFLIRVIVYIPLLVVFPVIVVGRKNIRRKGRVILCCNHQSNGDPIVIWQRLFRRRFNIMAKDKLFKNKFVSFFIKCFGGYPVNRGTTDITAIKKTIGLLKKDKAVCIFPEGTRLKTEETNELKSGTVIFALKTNSPIVPAMFVKKIRPFTFNKLRIGKEFDLAKEIGYNAGDKITLEIIDEGLKVLHNKMFELIEEKKRK